MATTEQRHQHPTSTGTAKTLKVDNPATGDRIAELPSLDREATLALVDRARAAQPEWDALGFKGRGALMRDMRRWLVQNRRRVIRTLSEAGYRVVVPDQIGFGKSSKPSGELHFDTLARNTIALLDHLQIAKAEIVAHSLGGMLGVRIARGYPDRVAHLLLTAPIGLEDYRFYVPPTPTEKIMENEDKLTAEGYRKQLETNYALKLPPDQVTPFIDARFNIKGSAEYPRWLRAFVASAQLIYREPVVHEGDGRRRERDGLVRAPEDLEAALSELEPEVVFDLSDEPVLGRLVALRVPAGDLIPQPKSRDPSKRRRRDARRRHLFARRLDFMDPPPFATPSPLHASPQSSGESSALSECAVLP